MNMYAPKTDHHARIQFPPAKRPAVPKRDKPIRQSVGAMVRGPMNRRRNPIKPVNPTMIYIEIYISNRSVKAHT